MIDIYRITTNKKDKNMKKLFKYTLPVVALCALASCSEDSTEASAPVTVPETVDPNAGKELIAFSQEGTTTRASLTRAGFTAQTKVYMRIKSEASGKTTRYAEATATASANTTDEHTNIKPELLTGISGHSDLTYDANQARYWDDAYGRDAKLTVYAFAIPGYEDAELFPAWTKSSWDDVDTQTNPNWYTASADDVSVTWPKYSGTNPALDQSAEETWKKLDLTYSNNISSSGTGGCFTTWDYSTKKYTALGNGQMKWVPKTNTVGETTGKFDQGHLVFKHALSWIEINLKEGAGFNNSANTDFKWSGNTTQNITLVGFNTVGTFNVSTGAWSGQTNNVNITKMYEQNVTTGGTTTRTLYAYVVPGTDLYNTSSNVVEFEIDEGKYYVTGKQIAEAIRKYYNETDGPGKDDTNASTYRSFTTLESGKHYVINLTVAKKSIDRITAAIIDWETVNSSDADADNTYPEFTLEDRGTKLVEADAPEFNIYRATKTATDFITGATEANYDWKSDYVTEGAATKTWNSTNSEWGTNWYWYNNKTYYHFRAAGNTENNSGTPTISLTKDETNGDYFTIKAGTIKASDHVDAGHANAAYYNNYLDYTWGAPFKDIESSAKLTYSTTYGFDGTSANTTHQISNAIGSTKSVIRMLLFHMTSQIFVNVRTTTGDDKVTLDNGAATPVSATTVEILNFLPDGTVRMGDGLVTATGTRKDNLAMINGTYKAASSSDPNRVEGYEYGMVPQPLTYATGTIGLRITTPDGNQYVVKDLSQCYATVSATNLTNPYTVEKSSGSNTWKIDRWYPSYKYTYTVTIKKTGIDRITAAVVPWETVTGDLGTIDLEN